jgi:hypothetical protein
VKLGSRTNVNESTILPFGVWRSSQDVEPFLG